ncbi:MAG: hypothetical protein HKN49_01750 [Gammaproteobacteria bacterium]|nr:hypothetical protein [Gammaproteobacteria bacterium]
MRLLAASMIILFLSGCATVYETESFDDLTASHKTVAILEPEVGIDLRKLPDGMTQEDVRKLEVDEAGIMYDALYSRFLNRYQKGEYTVSFQDVDETQVILRRNNVADTSTMTKQELAEMLGVDAVISTKIRRSKPMGTGAAIATTLLFGFGVTNEVSVNLKVHDGASGTLLWSYDHEVSGNLGSSAEGLAENLMKGISRRFPYSEEAQSRGTSVPSRG